MSEMIPPLLRLYPSPAFSRPERITASSFLHYRRK